MSRGFLFDLDGVLVDSTWLVRQGWLHIAAARGVELTDDDFAERLYGRRTVDVLVDVFGHSAPEAAALVAAGVEDENDRLADERPMQEVPGACAFVRSAAELGVSCALVTSATAPHAAAALRSIGLGNVFQTIVDAGQTERGKPFPDPYLAAAAVIGVRASEIVVFEDSPAGIASAKAAGARCVAVATCVPRDRLAAADLIIDDFIGLEPAAVLAL